MSQSTSIVAPFFESQYSCSLLGWFKISGNVYVQNCGYV